MSDLAEIRKLLLSLDDFVIAGHVNPDGDAIGACYALAMTLRKLGKKANVLLEEYSDKFQVIPGAETLYRGDLDALCAGVLLCVDCGSADRLGAAEELISRVSLSICIDHHVSNTFYTDYTYLDADASSASELVYRLISPVAELDVAIASALYAGIIWDTGGFRHGSTTAEAMRIAAELIDLGIPFTHIYNELMYRHSSAEAAVFGAALINTRFYHGGSICCSCVSHELMTSLGATGQDVDGIVEYLLNTRGVQVSVFIYEKKKGSVKVSFRSKEADVSKTAQIYGGGGHVHAAGATVTGEMEEVRDCVIRSLINACHGDASAMRPYE